ncbi:protein of unknown function [Methylotuvimicrobium alcaliphilum 20Z]|uniref:Uncharacterized protein n=1 Tax=Methylotuvimicrobium alcaliphilum (strain DSM 19304 / NCIMB 14124 / VKM B-2133 / 20Z) TaxID=1091494 RepID=G4SZ22_META2|nr:protein of unknown function [Methylotuvimicrobium alcaliphilum 20Z]
MKAWQSPQQMKVRGAGHYYSIFLHIEKLDKDFGFANFHSNVHEGLAIAPANESSLVGRVRSLARQDAVNTSL